MDGKVNQPTAAAAGLVEDMLSHLKPTNFVDYEPNSQVAKFYANRSVFITGATGFIGKVIRLNLTCFYSRFEQNERGRENG